ncbi:hypothetical protein BASA50_005540 [Batrachochytrium salamandrivorans]|uniref:SAP domain-containing protein n=1 Tax=Batrachochytrium salamandrivorans TaxID=1357716 RepID=A0ABQ8FCR1_9FUNG|nr:hypothetical protein BASA50_005540 [Batrachochytrium salamandrivorans]
MSIFMNSYALQFQQSHQLALVAQIYACSPYAQLDQYFGYWRQPPATYPVVGYPSQWSLQNNGVCSATPQSDFFGNVQAYPYLSDSERRQIALEQGILINIPVTSKEDQDILPKMIRIPISGNEESDLEVSNPDVCEDLSESSLIHISDTVNDTVENTVVELLSSEVAQENPESPLQIDVCFASAADIEAKPLVEVVVQMVEAVEVVEVDTAQPHQSVDRTKVLEQALKKIGVPTRRQKNALVHTTAPKRPRANRAQPPLAPKHKSATKIAPSTSTEQVRIPHAWEAALPTTPKKERFHARPKKPQTHSVTQASGRQNISGDVRNHPDLISTVKKNRHNTNRDGQPKIGPIKRK